MNTGMTRTLQGLAAAALLVATLGTTASASLVHESATLGSTGQSGGVSAYSFQHVASRFSLTSTTQVRSVGAHFGVAHDLGGSGGTFNFLIVALSGPTAFPNNLAPYFGAIAMSRPFLAVSSSKDVQIPLSVTLPPGHYALVLGSNDPYEVMELAGNDTDIPGQASYMYWHQFNGYWRNGYDNIRFWVSDSLCGDGNLETGETCEDTDAESGDCCTSLCQQEPDGGICDGNFCNLDGICSSGVCADTAPRVCDDSNSCTNDSCNAGASACNYAPNTNACDDGQYCTVSDVCSGGACGGVPNCQDGNACTEDTCDEGADSCASTNTTDSCDDGLFCTSDDQCADGFCGGQARDCNDGEFCTIDSCDETANQCATVPNPCSDGEECTIDSCDSELDICRYATNSGACDDGLYCTVGDTCEGGTCAGTAPRDCSDDDVCTNDVCDEGSNSCTFPFNNAGCDDGDLCTTNDKCAAGACGGEPYGPDTCLVAVKNKFLFDSGRAVFKWTWAGGEAFDTTDVGDPSSVTRYAVCFVDEHAGSPEVMLGIPLEIGDEFWTVGAKTGYGDEDTSMGSPFDKASLKSGAAGRTKLTMRNGRLSPVPLPGFSVNQVFDQDPGVSVQLVNSNGVCWGSRFTKADNLPHNYPADRYFKASTK